MVSENTLLQKAVGVLVGFDRLIFHGHLMAFFSPGAMERYLARAGVLIKDLKDFLPRKSEEILLAAKRFAADHGRPYTYLEGASTRASGDPKLEKARAIAERDHIREGLICVFSVLENCSSFKTRFCPKAGHPVIARAPRKCLHLYFYFLDREFGFIHVRLQTWFPFQIQVYINGRDWLGRLLDRAGIGYRRYDNAFVSVDDLLAAQALAQDLAHRAMASPLAAIARQVNALLPEIKAYGFGHYYWCVDQAEIATDIMFRSREDLAEFLPDLLDHGIRAFSPPDILRFLGRKLHPSYKGEVITRFNRRPEGCRLRHWAGRNSIKMYDKLSVLRIETTINNPRDFKVFKTIVKDGQKSWRWCPMGKGVANLWRYAQIGQRANRRYLDAMDAVQPQGKAIEALDDLCRSRTRDGKRTARFHPVTRHDADLFSAVLDGAHHLRGFRNRDLVRRLYPSPPATRLESRRRAAVVTRAISKLRGHSLIARIPRTRRYRATRLGQQVMYAAVSYRNPDFPRLYAQAPEVPSHAQHIEVPE